MTSRKKKILFTLAVLITIAVTVLVATPVVAQPVSCTDNLSLAVNAYPNPYPAFVCKFLPLMGKDMFLSAYPAP